MIKKITHLEAYSVRQPVLRPGKSIKSCQFVGDEFRTTSHFGYFIDFELIGIVSVFENKSIYFDHEHAYQIRGMAVLEHHQNKGLGQLLMVFCENYVLEKKANLIWFNARINAIKFYEKLGYKIHGDLFEIEGVGSHFVMFKQFVD